MPVSKPYTQYTFADHTGYLAAPWLPDATQEVVAIRHSENADPWRDESVRRR